MQKSKREILIAPILRKARTVFSFKDKIHLVNTVKCIC